MLIFLILLCNKLTAIVRGVNVWVAYKSQRLFLCGPLSIINPSITHPTNYTFLRLYNPLDNWSSQLPELGSKQSDLMMSLCVYTQDVESRCTCDGCYEADSEVNLIAQI
jgi:hypothetical protein